MASTKYSKNAVLSELAKGELLTGTNYTTGITLTSGTEVVVVDIGDDATNIILPYVTIVFGAQDSAVQLCYEWFIIRNDTGATPDFSTAATLERWMVEKKIFDRGFIVQPWIGATDMKLVKRTLFNVSLEHDEYLQLLILPRVSSGAGTVAEFAKTERRQISMTVL